MAKKRSQAVQFNRDELVEQSVVGQVSTPTVRAEWRVGPDGVPHILPGVGGISYNVRVGDSAVRWAADHVEPGVSVKSSDKTENTGLNTLSCVGNVGRVLGGEAKGAEGVVTGKHGGIEHVLMDFDDDAVEALAVGDRIQVRACGLGMRLLNAPEVRVTNVSPALLEAMAPRVRAGRLEVPVARSVPAGVMGSGLGRSNAFGGDYDIQLFDEEVVAEYGLDELRLGDLVTLLDADTSYGRVYRTGAVTVGVVVHSCCTTAGHGPGVTSLFSSADGLIDTVPDEAANLADVLRIGRKRPRGKEQ